MKRLTVLGLALLLTAACAPAGGSSAPEPVNSEDVMFLQMMIPHHRQGIEIVKQARDKGKDQQLKTFAAAIETTQTDEVKTMMGWLRSWGQPMTAPSDAHAAHGGLPETDREQIARLTRSKNFERDFLQLLIAHQDDAVQLAGLEALNGDNPTVKGWAEKVKQSRKAQIEQMKGMLPPAP
ncbi:DUF305 domain-containing protein [Nonomuraea longicatena]|uniref:DUF305 domain-containing protein n=1 Tax=Nonomuraea longicatena TaxID=83682 RepID=A0ABN1QZ78_9ACTN